ncbi:Pleiotropic drug resistance protein 3 [Hibiscus syriacus]|uniref:Pleiotropic drug resistance protein 3 n=1 Tax=Hibiscus syriacus TaxID=106335 RepID=A0A6A2XT33_HIBSY|nr:Pleiotropic drug resistance protein 3 [Hibiscus syriacus]
MGSKSQQAKLSLISDVSGIIKPGRMTLLLGPPGCGKTTLLKALSGSLDRSLQVTGKVSYNGFKLEEFVPQKTCAYISQNDFHISEMTVRETLDFSAHCQGVESRAAQRTVPGRDINFYLTMALNFAPCYLYVWLYFTEMMNEVIKREAEAGIVPDPVIDTYMQATSVKVTKTTLQTDYILKILGIDICAETFVGDALRIGISGGQKKRLSTGEIVVDATLLVSLLQPGPETFVIFDDVILMEEGKICTMDHAIKFLNFSKTVLCKQDQAQYWCSTEQPYSYFSVDMFSKKFEASSLGKKIDEDLLEPYDKSQVHKDSLSFTWAYAIPAVILKLPMSFLQSLIWTSITYFVMGYTPEVSRFFRQFVTFFAVQLTGISLFRFIASVFQNFDSSVAASSLIIFLHWLFCGFIIPQSSWPGWMKWLFWVSPISYAEIALSGNELLAPRWQQVSFVG